MDFIQPTDEIITDKTQAENARVIQLRNQATILEGEIKRLKDLTNSENYNIAQLVKAKLELESSIPVLQNKELELINIKSELEISISQLEEQKSSLVVFISSETEKLTEGRNELNKAMLEVSSDKEEIEKIKIALIEEKRILDTKIQEFDNKLAKLKDILN